MEGGLVQSPYNHASDLGIQAVDHIAQQVMGHGPGHGGSFNFELDRVGFKQPYPDGEHHFAGQVVEHHDRHAR